ncbi:unnamed protein product, partial [Cladocopium goreaui]
EYERDWLDMEQPAEKASDMFAMQPPLPPQEDTLAAEALEAAQAAGWAGAAEAAQAEAQAAQPSQEGQGEAAALQPEGSKGSTVLSEAKRVISLAEENRILEIFGNAK